MRQLLRALALSLSLIATAAQAAVPVLRDFTQTRGALTKGSNTVASAHGPVPLDQSDLMLVSTDSPITSCAITPISPAVNTLWNLPTDCTSPSPNAAGDAADLAGGPFTFSVTATNGSGTSVAKTLTINVVANTYTVSSYAQVDTSLHVNRVSLYSGKTIAVAYGSYYGHNSTAATRVAGAFNGNGGHSLDAAKLLQMRGWNTSGADYVTLTSEDLTHRSTLSAIKLYGGKHVHITGLILEGYLGVYDNTDPTECPTISRSDPKFVSKCLGYRTNQQNTAHINITGNATFGAADDVLVDDITVGGPSTTGPSQWRTGLAFSGYTIGTPASAVYATNIHVDDVALLRVKGGITYGTLTDSVFENFTIDTFSGDGVAVGGFANQRTTVQDGVIVRGAYNPLDGSTHGDNLQIGATGTGSDYTQNIVRRMVIADADGDYPGHLVFLNDVGENGAAGPGAGGQTPTGFSNNQMTLENLLLYGMTNHGMTLDYGLGYVIRRNGVYTGDSYASDPPWNHPGFNTYNSATVVSGLLEDNVFQTLFNTNPLTPWPSLYTDNTVMAQVYPVNTALWNPSASLNPSSYRVPYQNQVVQNADTSDIDYPNLTAAQIATALKTHFAPIAGKSVAAGGLMNADGTYRGPLFPNATWNDGSQYGATPATRYSITVPQATWPVGSPLTITVELDAAADQTYVITPDLQLLTGESFNPATVTITAGNTSGTTALTGAQVGTGRLVSSSSPVLIPDVEHLINFTAPLDVDPTAYTQSANRTAVALGGSILVTWTLNAPATLPVTLTATNDIAGSWSAPTVIIPNGQTSAQLFFLPSAIGSGTLAANDNRGLTDPAGIAITVARNVCGQLKRYGMC